MEAQAILDMCTQCPYFRSFVCWWIMSDDDSSMRAVLCHPCSPPNPNEKGMLPAHIIKPEFKADPSHRLKVVSKYFYKLKDLPVSKSRMTSELAKRLKRSWGYMLKQNRHKSLDEFLHAAKAPLHHTFDDHTYCSESWCQPLKAKKENKKYSNPQGWLSRDTKDGEILFKQIEEITSKYGSEFFLRQSMHPFSTQTNEALNRSQSCLTPKDKLFHSSRSFHYRNSIMVGCHNWGFDTFWLKVFTTELGIIPSKIFKTFLYQIKSKRKYWKSYHCKIDVKRKRAYKQHEIEKAQMYENRTKNVDYGSGTGLDIGFAQPPTKKIRAKRTQCRCGSTSHLTTRSKQCPLNKDNLKVAENLTEENIILMAAPTVARIHPDK